MKKNNGIPLLIFIVSLIISIGLSIWALIIANANFDGLVFDFGKVTDFVGLLFSVAGVVFTIFFVIVGVDAIRIKKQLDSLINEVEEKKAQIDRYIKRLECDNLDDMYGQILSIAATITSSKERKRIINSLTLSRARLATQSIFLDKETRIQRIPTLQSMGELSDIDELSKLINDPYEDKDIVELAKVTRDELLKRLKIK